MDVLIITKDDDMTMHSPLQVYMKDLLKGVCDCSLTDDNPRVESVADVMSTNNVLVVHSNDGKDHRQEFNCAFGHGATIGEIKKTSNCFYQMPQLSNDDYDDRGAGESRVRRDNNHRGLLEATTSLASPSHQRPRTVRPLDDSVMGLPAIGDIGSSKRTMVMMVGRTLQRTSSLPVEESTRWDNHYQPASTHSKHSKKHNTQSREEHEVTKQKRLRMKKGAFLASTTIMMDRNRLGRASSEGNTTTSTTLPVVECNPRKLVDSNAESAGCAPPSRPERKMSYDLPLTQEESGSEMSQESNQSQDNRVSAALDLLSTRQQNNSPNLLGSNDNGTTTRDLYTSIEFHESISTSNDAKKSLSNFSIIDSVNRFWSTPKETCSSLSLLSMAKTGVVPLPLVASVHKDGQQEAAISEEGGR